MLFGPTIVFFAGTGDYRLGIPYDCNSSVLLYFFLFISHWFLFSRRECSSRDGATAVCGKPPFASLTSFLHCPQPVLLPVSPGICTVLHWLSLISL